MGCYVSRQELTIAERKQEFDTYEQKLVRIIEQDTEWSAATFMDVELTPSMFGKVKKSGLVDPWKLAGKIRQLNFTQAIAVIFF